MEKDLFKRGKINRLMQIITSLQAGKSYSVTELSKIFGTSRRTIFRDMKELRAIGIPYYYDAKTRRYTIEPEFSLPAFDLSLREALNLLLVALKLGKQIQLPSPKSTLLAALKIENNLPAKIRRYCNDTLQNILVKEKPQEIIDSFDKIFAQLMLDIQNNRIVNIRYYLPLERIETTIVLEPYHLIYNDHTWYLIGRSTHNNKIHNIKLNRIKQLIPSGKYFAESNRLDIEEYFGRAWSIVPEGRLYHIKLKFSPEVAHDVAAVKWHSTQKVTFENDGSANLEFRVDGLNEITWWILSYGDRVQVLVPKILREKVTMIVRRMLDSNQQESTTP
jgi:predicted DNA-binding transcriptional regulator YafY